MESKIRLAVVTVMLTTMFINMTSTEMFTSSLKIQRMVEEEDRLLAELKRFIDRQFVRVKNMSNFYKHRSRDLSFNKPLNFDPSHPNAVFNAIKRFWTDYSAVMGEQLETFQSIAEKDFQAYVADSNDVQGAIVALLRLQSVYNLRAMDMAKGHYLGYQGPQLQYEDAYKIGKTAFSMEGYVNETIEWLNTSLTLYTWESLNNTGVKFPGPTVAAMKALLGGTYLRNGNRNVAEQLFNDAVQLDPNNEDVLSLKFELEERQLKFESKLLPDYFRNFTRLCSTSDRYDPEVPVSPLAVCRYRQAVLPYYRFQEEILSISPFVTLIYNVISDAEGEHIKGFVEDKLGRATIGTGTYEISDTRTGEVAWISEGHSGIATSIAKRIECITGLDVQERLPGGPSSGEPFQVVNYGIGGFYDVHTDPLETEKLDGPLRYSGDRLATFLIYLTDVEKGGSTIFTQAGISVAPVKNMALMWYNFDPAIKLDNGTHHAGCPVLFGQKWIVNKWIWSNGNMFRRRCGLKPDVTQLDIEADMINGYQ